MNKDLEILENLIKIPSPSGYEHYIAKYIKHELLKILSAEQIQIDKHHNVIVTIAGKSDKIVLIDAHSDEIGMIVTNVNRWGQISLQYIGGADNAILSARHLDIVTKHGTVNAVVNRKHSHLVTDEDDESIYAPEQADVDIGIRDREQILKTIQIGDPIVFRPNFRQLQGNFFTGYGFDDKAGCFLAIQTIKDIVKSKQKPEATLMFVFSTQEETGSSKLFPIVRKYKPSLVIEADVTFASDYSDVDMLEMEVGRCNLGQGIVLYRGVDIDEKCWDEAVRIAKQRKIPYQVQAVQGVVNAGYTSLAVSGEADGIKALIWGIPLRNMHCPTEIINLDDIYNGTKLLKYFLLSKKLTTLI